MNTLRRTYDVRRTKNERIVQEGILDAFQSNSENVTKVRNALQHAKNVSQTYGMKNVMRSVSMAEQKFEQAIANDKMRDRGTALSYILTFSDIMSDFFRELDQWIMQLPSVAQAIEASSNPENATKTLKELVGMQGDKVSPVLTLANIIQKQFDKSAGGFLKSVGRLFKTGSLTTAAQTLEYVGLNAQLAAEDILNVQASKYNQLTKAGDQVPPVQISMQPAPPESGSTQSARSAQSIPSQTSAASQQSVPAQGTTATVGNAQMAQKPSPQDAQKRDGVLQGAIKNRNAFNTQAMSALSNEEIKSDLQKIARALGFSLT